jgi:plastocyanin
MRLLRAAVLGLLLAAGTATAAFADVVQVRIDALAFGPADVSARVGDTIEWSNSDFVDHTATARSGAWDFVIPEGGSARLELKRAGDVEYYCKYHPMMVGRIHVAAQ